MGAVVFFLIEWLVEECRLASRSGWDVVFGTYDRVERVRIPRRLAAISVAWLVDEDGEVRAQFGDEYEVAGRRERDDQRLRQDRDEAFANLVPTP